MAVYGCMARRANIHQGLRALVLKMPVLLAAQTHAVQCDEMLSPSAPH